MAPRRLTAILALLLLLAGACASTEDTASDTAVAEPVPADTTEAAAAPVAPTEVPEVVAVQEPAATNAAPPYAALNEAEGYGFLRLMTLEERPDSLDIVIYEAIPNELPRVAGVITAVAQTPLSHVNLRAIQDGVPNAFIENPLDDPAISANLGRYVHYAVTADGWVVKPATQAEVEAHHAAARPSESQVPERDLTIDAITPLDQIGFDEWSAFGVKTANLATLGGLALEAEVPDGYGVPFSFYDEFMAANGFYDEVADLLADPEFLADQDMQQARLEQLRDDIKDAPLSDAAMTELAEVQASFGEGASIRCRSSTNNEDLPNFSGAGLYDSYTQHPEEGHLAKCITQVFASTWNFRAFLEREFYRIDHFATAMGVLLHPNFEDEQANGVAVSADPVYDTEGAYYVNTQLGEDLVTNPEALSVPEALLLRPDGSAAVLTYSNLTEPGALLMSDAHLAQLQASLSTVHDGFAQLYGVQPGDQFAMEIEFKVTREGVLSIKQARPWVFT